MTIHWFIDGETATYREALAVVKRLQMMPDYLRETTGYGFIHSAGDTVVEMSNRVQALR